MEMLKGKNIVVGVTGGIAAYKAVEIVSRLKKLGANVDVIMTDGATKFVTPLTFQSLSQNHVTVDLFKEPKVWEIEHISLAQKADMFIIAPATANIIGKVANGIADDMISTTILATKAKVVFAPAMNTNMYTNLIFKENMKKLKKFGYEFIKPASGRLACGTYGEGKMAEPATIVKYIENKFMNKDLEGKNVIVTAGPTVELIDPVRYITNHSSGKMGYAIAEEAKLRGANVTLVTGPTNLEEPNGMDVIKINTTEEMFKEVEKKFENCEILIKAAAPLDYKPETFSENKIKKNGNGLEIKFIRTLDILHHFGQIKKKQIIVGFAAETENLIKNAKIKIAKKNLDIIVANNISLEDAGFKSETNIATILDKYGDEVEYTKLTKVELSKIIIDKVIEMME